MKIRNIIVGLVAVLAMAGFAFGAGHELTIEGKAHYGATHEIQVTFEDFAGTTVTNSTYTNTYAIPAKAAVEYVGMRLVEAFDTAATNWTSSVAVTVGDKADADFYQTSTELAEDGTEIYAALPRPSVYTILAADVGGTNYMTNIVSGVFGYKYYNVASNLVVTFTPDYAQKLSASTKGDVRFLFKILDPTKNK